MYFLANALFLTHLSSTCPSSSFLPAVMINLRFIASDSVSLLLTTGLQAVVFKTLVGLLSLVKYGGSVNFFLYQSLHFCLQGFLDLGP